VIVYASVKGTLERPRLSVYRSNENIYAQIIDDTTSTTLVSCSTLDRDIKLDTTNGRTCEASRRMGEKLAALSLKKNITKIVFDRGPYIYHGRIKALADGARAGGLQF
jgi:large subunit ribosomal protein L18